MSIIAQRVKKLRKDYVPFSELAIRHNHSLLEYCHTSASALSGSTAGILGLTGLHGFIFYFIATLIVSIMLVIKAGSQWQKFFRARFGIFTNGLFGGLFTYVLFWTFIYGMVHVY